MGATLPLARARAAPATRALRRRARAALRLEHRRWRAGRARVRDAARARVWACARRRPCAGALQLGRGPRASARPALPRGSRRRRTLDDVATAAEHGVPQPTGRACSRPRFLGGGALLALEVVWFRFLQLFVFGTQLAFALMLATVLAGIALGGLLAAAWLRRRPASHPCAAARRRCSGWSRPSSTYVRVRPGHAERGHEAMRTLWLSADADVADVARIRSRVHAARRGAAGERGCRATPPRRAGSRSPTRWARRLGAPLAGLLLLPWLGVDPRSSRSRCSTALASRCSSLPWAPGSAAARADRPRPGVFALVMLLFPFGLMRGPLPAPAGRVHGGRRCARRGRAAKARPRPRSCCRPTGAGRPSTSS